MVISAVFRSRSGVDDEIQCWLKHAAKLDYQQKECGPWVLTCRAGTWSYM